MEEKKNGTKKTINVSIPIELWIPLRVEAARQDQGVSRFVAELVASELRQKLEAESEAEA